MKILITNNDLYYRAGSQLFTAELAFCLRDRGHEVFVFTPMPGLISQEMQEKGIQVVDDLLKMKDESLDLIHAQHNTTAIMARSVFIDTPMVMMVHGVLPELEQPPSINIGISRFIAVSEEVQEHLQKQYQIPVSRIILVRNFVDLEKFYCQKPVSQVLKKVLVISNHYTEDVRKVVEGAAKRVGASVEHIGMPDRSVPDTEAYINDSDLVISLGRGALQAMACERNVIVYDMHGADGMVDEENFYELRKCNFSGRAKKMQYTEDDLVKELQKYDPVRGSRLRFLVEKEYSVNNVFSDLEQAYSDALNENERVKSKLQEGEMYREMSLLMHESMEKIRILQCRDNLMDVNVKNSMLLKERDLEISRLKKHLFNNNS